VILYELSNLLELRYEIYIESEISRTMDYFFIKNVSLRFSFRAFFRQDRKRISLDIIKLKLIIQGLMFNFIFNESYVSREIMNVVQLYSRRIMTLFLFLMPTYSIRRISFIITYFYKSAFETAKLNLKFF
jgi:hypothetical protein